MGETIEHRKETSVSFVTCCCRIHLRLFPVRGKHIHYVPFDSWFKANFSEIGEKSRVPDWLEGEEWTLLGFGWIDIHFWCCGQHCWNDFTLVEHQLLSGDQGGP